MIDETEILNSAAFEAEVDAIRENVISAKFIEVYRSSNSKFLLWMLTAYPDLCTDEFKSYVERLEKPVSAKNIAEMLQHETSIKPILFNLLKARHFLRWIVTLRKKNGEKLGNPAYSSRRAGLFSLFRDFNEIMRPKLADEMKFHFKGLKRTVAQATTNGDIRIKVGKDPLQFSFYQ